MKMHTLQELRGYGLCPDHQIIPITADNGPMLADALEIADESALMDIECCCKAVAPAGAGQMFWDARTAARDDRENVERAVRYLDSRGLLDRHPDNRNWVSPRCEDHPTTSGESIERTRQAG